MKTVIIRPGQVRRWTKPHDLAGGTFEVLGVSAVDPYQDDIGRGMMFDVKGEGLSPSIRHRIPLSSIRDYSELEVDLVFEKGSDAPPATFEVQGQVIPLAHVNYVNVDSRGKLYIGLGGANYTSFDYDSVDEANEQKRELTKALENWWHWTARGGA